MIYQPFAHIPVSKGYQYDLPPQPKQERHMKKLTPEVIQSLIVNTEYQRFELLTVCVLTLQNGFKVTGQRSPVSAENFNADIGKQIAQNLGIGRVFVETTVV